MFLEWHLRSARAPTQPVRRDPRRVCARCWALEDRDILATAQELFIELRQQGHGLGLATVYRALHVLRDQGLLHIGFGVVAEAAFAVTNACIGTSRRPRCRSRPACLSVLLVPDTPYLTPGGLLGSHPLTPPGENTQRQQAIRGVDPDRLPVPARVRADEPVSRNGYYAAIEALLHGLLERQTSEVRQDPGG